MGKFKYSRALCTIAFCLFAFAADAAFVWEIDSLYASGNAHIDGTLDIGITPATASPESVLVRDDDSPEVRAVPIASFADYIDFGLSMGYIPLANSSGQLIDSCLFWDNCIGAVSCGSQITYGDMNHENPFFRFINGSYDALSRTRLNFMNYRTYYGNDAGTIAFDWVKLIYGDDDGYSRFELKTITDISPEIFMTHLAILEETGQLILNDSLHVSDPRSWAPVWIRNNTLRISALNASAVVVTDGSKDLVSSSVTVADLEALNGINDITAPYHVICTDENGVIDTAAIRHNKYTGVTTFPGTIIRDSTGNFLILIDSDDGQDNKAIIISPASEIDS